MFKNTEEFEDILLHVNKLLEEVALFECYNDSIATFSYLEDDLYHEFKFNCDDTFWRDMKISELLNLKRITYFAHDIYSKDLEGLEKMGGIQWSCYDISRLN